jgi:hypothetical protein
MPGDHGPPPITASPAGALACGVSLVSRLRLGRFFPTALSAPLVPGMGTGERSAPAGSGTLGEPGSSLTVGELEEERLGRPESA